MKPVYVPPPPSFLDRFTDFLTKSGLGVSCLSLTAYVAARITL